MTTVIVTVCGLIVLSLATGFFVDWDWFSSLGYGQVFWTIVAAKVALFAAVFAVSGAAIWANGFIAHHTSGPHLGYRLISSPWDSLENVTPPALLERLYRRFPWSYAISGLALVLAFFIATAEYGGWDLALRFYYQAPYRVSDPLFGKDIGFYLFSLPVYVALKNWMVGTLAITAICTLIIYWLNGAIVITKRRPRIAPAPIVHASILLGLFFATQAWASWLGRYLLVYDDNGVVVGASYTDVHVALPILRGLVALYLAGTIACLVNVRVKTYRIPLIAISVIIGCSVIVAPLVTALFQRVYVKPNELRFEAPYIARNIDFTREAYDLKKIVVKPFQDNGALDAHVLEDNRATIDNIRLWDVQPLLDTYAQLQEIRTYYKFHDADIDRYDLNGSYQQVMISARELEPSLLPGSAQTWVNLHVLFTHGNGAVMSPVTQTTPDGLPKFYLRNIPPVVTGGPMVSEPRLYFGEGADSYVVVNTTTPEFDYPQGDKNVYVTYHGTDGVAIGALPARALFAWYLGDLNLLLSGYITGDSRIVFRRNIQERVRTIAPFLRLDADPYIVASGGRLFWIQDAYTRSNWFPYSKATDDGATNYMRNAVKVVIDAYNGTVRFYVSDPSDPIIATYQRIFPSLFQPLKEMPPDLQKHIRYPEDYFQLQAQLYQAYHMNTPEVFYNREDLWQFPRQPAGIDDSGDAKMAPYYINMRLPGETKTEFALMVPMVPSQRDNMIAWLAARSDQPNYGKLVVFEFPKDKLVYGPFQIEALIHQNTEISQQISLWNQMGSRVIRGNLLVIPIDNSILYVTPLYLRAQSGQLPELQRVIAIYGNQVVMQQTLAEALAALFKSPTATPSPAMPAIAQSPPPGVSSDVGSALDHYDQAISRLKAGDWGGFGTELDALGSVLQKMKAQQRSVSATGAGADRSPVHK
jgi:uncharacterized membrane protein (UPF0182 family)